MLTQRTDFTSLEAVSHLFPLNMIDQDGPGKLAGDRKDQENLSISIVDRGTKGTREESGQVCQSKRGQESQGKTGGVRRTKKDRDGQEESVESWDRSGGGGRPGRDGKGRRMKQRNK